MEIKGKKQEVFNKMVEFLDKCSDEETIHCYFSKKETKKIRTLSQNNFWYWLFWEIEKQTPFSSEVIKQYILSRVFWKQRVFWDIINLYQTS